MENHTIWKCIYQKPCKKHHAHKIVSYLRFLVCVSSLAFYGINRYRLKHSGFYIWLRIFLSSFSPPLSLSFSADYKHSSEGDSPRKYPHRQPLHTTHYTCCHGYTSMSSRGQRMDPRVCAVSPPHQLDILINSRLYEKHYRVESGIIKRSGRDEGSWDQTLLIGTTVIVLCV